MDPPSAAQFELLVALAKGISYKSSGRSVLKANSEAGGKKAYEKPVLSVYGDIRTMTEARSLKAGRDDGMMFRGQNLKTG